MNAVEQAVAELRQYHDLTETPDPHVTVGELVTVVLHLVETVRQPVQVAAIKALQDELGHVVEALDSLTESVDALRVDIRQSESPDEKAEGEGGAKPRPADGLAVNRTCRNCRHWKPPVARSHPPRCTGPGPKAGAITLSICSCGYWQGKDKE